MNAYRTLATQIAVVLLIGSFLPGAYAWRTAVSTTDPGNTDPGFTNPDGLNAPWQDGATPLPTTAGTKIWIAIDNYHIATNTKTVALGLINPAGVEPRVNSVEGYYDTADGVQQSEWVDNRVLKAPLPGGRVGFAASLRPQPDWEVFEIEFVGNKSGGSVTGGEIDLQISGDSNCVRSSSTPTTVVLDEGQHNGPEDFGSITDIVIFPENAPLNLSAPIDFLAPPTTGFWNYEPVFADPFGEPRPQGGVRFFADGPGLQTWDDLFHLELSVQQPESWYVMYMLDQATGNWQVYLLNVLGGSNCPGDVDGDGDVDFDDLNLLLAAYGTGDPLGDLDGDGDSDFDDLNLLLANYGNTCP